MAPDFFPAGGWTGTRKDGAEGELRWVPRAEVESLNLWQGDRIFLALLARDEPFFSLKLTYRGDDLVGAVLNGVPLS